MASSRARFTVGRVIRRLGFSVKKTLIATERDRPYVLQRKEEYGAEVRGIAATRLVFVDETGTVNLTVVGAIALDGVRAMMAHEGGTTREALLKFVLDALVPSLSKGDVVVMDNLRVHYTDGVKSSIEAAGAKVMYLPPHSRELNPTELALSKTISVYAQSARSLNALASALPYAQMTFRPTDFAGWFRHAGYEAEPDGCALYIVIRSISRS